MTDPCKFDNRWLFENLIRVFKTFDKRIQDLLKSQINNYIHLSKFLGKYENFVYDYRKESRRYRIFALSVLNGFKKSINKHFKHIKTLNPKHSLILEKAQNKLYQIIDTYIIIHKPKDKPRSQILQYHPNLNLDYFKVINKKQKAYWLGFIYADGYISINKKEPNKIYRVGIAISWKDKILLERFCEAIGGNKDFIKKEKILSITGSYIDMARFRIVNNRFASHLVNHGVFPGKNKAQKIHLPKFSHREFDREGKKLYLAFLLGYYDGDGTISNQGQAKIFSSNFEFLKEIKLFFKLKTKILKETKRIKDPNRNKIMITKICRLTIPRYLLKEMMLNYSKSLNRKRESITNFQYKKRENKIQNWIKKNLSREILKEMMEDVPITRIAKLIEVNYETFQKVLKDYKLLKNKKKNYWSTIALKKGHRIEIPPKWIKFLKKIRNERQPQNKS